MTSVGFTDGLAKNYDKLDDLWYSWLFSRLHFIITKEVINKFHPRQILDIGCGTGFQSLLHAYAGAIVNGIDISEEIIQVAREKAEIFNSNKNLYLFPSRFKFVDRYNSMINSILKNKSRNSSYTKPKFQVADAVNIPFPDKSFDHINCCGSTISFIEKHHLALLEIARLLKPRGTLFFEIESRWNFDLLWTFLDAILKHRLGYGTPFKETIKNILSSPQKYIHVNYPIRDADKNYYFKLKSFTLWGMRRELSNLKFKILKKWTIHSTTNIIPSKILDRANPSKLLQFIFRILAKVEEKIPINLPGCSLSILARKGD
jgi:ubiquinone/menaquinone biosynthesis C-methylase UbiE